MTTTVLLLFCIYFYLKDMISINDTDQEII